MKRSLPILLPLSLVFAFGCSSSSKTSPLAPGAGGDDTSTGNTTSTGVTGSTTTGSGGGPTSTGVGGSGGSGGNAACGADVDGPTSNDLMSGSDPAKGNFTMADALVDLPAGPGPLRAIIDTDLGTLTCTLRPDKTPIGTANFVGLARGRRPWKDPKTGKWVLRRFYDGLTFHRVIPGFVAQGGDPLGTGFGGPGYKFMDEITDLTHVPGALAYANSGLNTNGSQFYVADGAQPSLDNGKYTVFGVCTPGTVIAMLTGVPRDANDKPLTPLHMKTVTITQCAP